MLDINETTGARSYMSFNLNMMLLMINCGRTDEANRALAKLLDALDQIPEDLNITINQEIDNA
jgi:DNA recombination-dependent growth factor C